jgi:tRNA 2-thiouridine synthesizing protein E
MVAVFAGVEPSPFHEIINQIGSVQNKMESVENQLEQILFKAYYPETEEEPVEREKKLDDLADVLCECKEKLDSLVSEVPADYRRSPVLQHALFGIEMESRNIINCIDQLYRDPENIDVAQERVKFNGQIVMFSTRTYSRQTRDGDARDQWLSRTQVSEVITGYDRIQVDEDGFIVDPSLWSEEFAAKVAASEGVDDLTDDHWKVVNYLRNYYIEYGVAPMIRKLCKETGFKLKKIYELFPSGPAKGACKIAGLPKPTGCV